MEDGTKHILMIFVLLLLAKSILAYFIPSISAFSDEYYYAKMARSFFFTQEFSIHNIRVMFYQPLYPIVLSISYIFRDMQTVYLLMKVINAILSSLIIIPSYFLAREFLDSKKSILAAALIGLAPSNFIFSSYLMSENLLYTLFVSSFYFLYKSFTSNKAYYFIISGIFIALSYLTKTSALLLIIIPLVFYVLNIMLHKEQLRISIKNMALMYATIAAIISPWIIRNIMGFGNIFAYNTISDITAYSRHESYLLPFLNWALLYTGYLILAGAMIFSIIAFVSMVKNFRQNTNEAKFYLLAIITILLFIIIAANHATGIVIYKSPIPFFTERPIGRYIDMVMPLLIIIGFINFYKYASSLNKYIVGSSFLVFFSSQLAIAQLLPPNNTSLTYIGILKYIMEFIFFNKTSLDTIFHWQSIIAIGIILMLACLSFIYIKKIGLSKVAALAMFFFVMTSMLAYPIVYYNAKNFWFSSDQMQIGYFLNEIDKSKYSTVLIDSRDCIGKIERLNQSTLCENNISSVAGFFVNDDIMVANPEETSSYDFAITKHKLDKQLIKSINGVNLYKND